MAWGIAWPDPRRVRSYFIRLPLATRILLFLLTAFYIAQFFSPGLEEWGALIPNEISINTRMFTYVLCKCLALITRFKYTA